MTGTGHMRVAAAVLAASFWTWAPAQAQEPIKIGFAGALSGPASFVGVEIKRGAEIAIDEINAKGGIGGRKLVRSRAMTSTTRSRLSRSIASLWSARRPWPSSARPTVPRCWRWRRS